MRDIKHNIKRAFKTSVLGHVCTIDAKPPMYLFLKEWFVLPYQRIDTLKTESLIWGFPHVVVFDLDSTLITEEEHVQIRDPFVYDSLQELKDMGCVLILWSYGCREHVSHAIANLELASYFDTIIAEGSTIKESSSSSSSNNTSQQTTSRELIVDHKLKKQFVVEKFDFDMELDRYTKYIPKSPKIVLKYLCDKNLNYIKSITLVDDLPSNNHGYDFYIKVKRCPIPVHDWEHYHNEILDNIINYNY